MSRPESQLTSTDRLLTVDEVAARLGTTTRFSRRLIAERRIAYVKLGRHVRIAESALGAYIAQSTVEAMTPAWHNRGAA